MRRVGRTALNSILARARLLAAILGGFLLLARRLVGLRRLVHLLVLQLRIRLDLLLLVLRLLLGLSLEVLLLHLVLLLLCLPLRLLRCLLLLVLLRIRLGLIAARTWLRLLRCVGVRRLRKRALVDQRCCRHFNVRQIKLRQPSARHRIRPDI